MTPTPYHGPIQSTSSFNHDLALTIRNMVDNEGWTPQAAFNEVCEQENYHGDRADVVADRVAIAKLTCYDLDIHQI